MIPADFAAATNYQDLWWVANGAESGWGVNLAHQGDNLFASWFTYDTDQLGQGRENARNYLRANPDLANELEKKIKELMNIGPQVDVPAGVDPVTGEVEF